MQPARHIAQAVLTDGDSSFSLDVVSWNHDDGFGEAESGLLVDMGVACPAGSWKARASALLAPELDDLARIARDVADGSGFGSMRLSTEDGTLGFRFRFDPDSGHVEVEVVVSDGSSHGTPKCDDSGREVLIRVPPDDISAFATALEEISRRKPRHVAWAG